MKLGFPFVLLKPLEPLQRVRIPTRISLWALPLVTIAVLTLTGCASSASKKSHKLTGDPVTDSRLATQSGKPQDKILWAYRGGLAALRRADFTTAKQLFDEAVQNLNGMFGKDRAARKSRGYFNRESRKMFYGEPYERAMAYYYRGILYWMDGEPDNARACFRSAQLQDTGTADDHYDADFVLFDYLDGLASTKLGSDGSDALKRSQAKPRIAIPPTYDTNANVLFFVEFGPGPRKVAGGEYGEQLQYIPGSSPVNSARIRVANFDVTVAPYDDLNFQATTRGGRQMDQILARKKGFKEGTSAVGDAAIISGAVLGATGSKHDETALGLVAAGLLSKILSASAKPEADTRCWDSLPLYLSFAAIPLPPGNYTLSIDFLNSNKAIVPALSKQITLTVSADHPAKVVFVSDQSTTPQIL